MSRSEYIHTLAERYAKADSPAMHKILEEIIHCTVEAARERVEYALVHGTEPGIEPNPELWQAFQAKWVLETGSIEHELLLIAHVTAYLVSVRDTGHTSTPHPIT